MTELEYVISRFDRAFESHAGKRIILHGSREYAENIIREFDYRYDFAGVITNDDCTGTFAGKPVFSKESLQVLSPDLIILTERVKHAEKAYQDISGICIEQGIAIFNMYGVDEVQMHMAYENTDFKRLPRWKMDVAPYDMVIFELMDAFFVRDESGGEENYRPRQEMKFLFRFLKRNKKKVFFSLRKSFPQQEQIKILKKSVLFENEEELYSSLIIREGDDLSLRKLNEQYPDKRKCYLGCGLVNEYMLPACYGIDPFRVRYEWYMPYDFDGEIKKIIAEGAKERTLASSSFDLAKKKVLEAEAVFFDVFDTLIVRKALWPGDVLNIWEQRAHKLDPKLPGGLLKARQKAQAEDPKADIFEIYEKLGEYTGLSQSMKRDLAELEMETEKQMTLRRERVCTLFDTAVKKGKDVYIISDTYYRADFIRELLSANGIFGYKKIFVSCEYKKTKYDGLFELAARHAGEEKNLLLIGNDPLADLFWGQRAGYETFHVPSPLDMAMQTNWKQAIDRAEERAGRGLVGIVISRVFNDPFQDTDPMSLGKSERLMRFAVAACAPVIIGYMTWLMSVLQGKSYQGILFSSRDGYILNRLYSAFLKKLNNPGKMPLGKYFYISRHAAFLTCMDDPEKMDLPLNVGSFMTGMEIIKNFFDIPEEDLSVREDNHGRKKFLLQNMEPIQVKCRQARSDYEKYLKKENIKSDGRYAIADFVAMGTSQDMLESGLGCRFDGLYFGMPLYEGGNDADISYYFSDRNDKFLRNFMEMESIMTSPEPSLKSFDDKGDPVFAREYRTEEELANVREAHRIIEEIADDFLNLYYKEEEVISPDLAEAVYMADQAHGVLNEAYDDWGGFKLNGEQFFSENLKGALLAWYPFKKDATVLNVEPSDDLYSLSKSVGETYDYVVIKEIPGRNDLDLVTFFEKCRELLKPGGILLAGFHNKNAAKYKCGGLDRYVTKRFDTHTLYAKDEISDAAEKVFGAYRYYYPMPDPLFVQAVYTDEYIPNQGIQDRVFAFDAFNSPLIADENEYYMEAAKRGTFADESNYCMVEMGKTDHGKHVIHAAMSADRSKAHAFATIIYSDDTVIKKALFPEGKKTLKEIRDNLQIIKTCGIQAVDCTLTDEGLKMPRIKEITALEHFRQLLDEGDKDGIMRAFRQMCDDMEKFERTSNKTGIDMIPYNAFYKDGKYIYFDQEYTEENCPVLYALWRAIHYTYLHLPDLNEIVDKLQLEESFGIEKEMAGHFEEKEKAFVSEVRQMKLYKRIYEWKEKSRNITQDF